MHFHFSTTGRWENANDIQSCYPMLLFRMLDLSFCSVLSSKVCVGIDILPCFIEESVHWYCQFAVFCRVKCDLWGEADSTKVPLGLLRPKMLCFRTKL